MEELLKLKLRSYLAQNRPDLLISLQQTGSTGAYLDDKMAQLNGLPERLLDEGKPPYIITELCMAALTADLGPSRFHVLSAIVDEDFLPIADTLRVNGLLTYELLNLLHVCEPVFEELGTDEDNRMLRYALTGTIQDYAQQNWTTPNIRLWLSHPSKN